MAIAMVEQCVSSSEDAVAAATSGVGKTRKRLSVAPLSMRKGVWEASKGKFPALSDVALMCCAFTPLPVHQSATGSCGVVFIHQAGVTLSLIHI